MVTSTNPITEIQTVAVIDVGSNAIRMVIGQINADGSIEHLEDLQRAVPLGQDSFSEGRISPRTINLAIEVLRGFHQILEPYGVQNLRAVATSAVREAANADLFVERIFASTGISVEVISGSEQDRLIYSAVRHAFQSENVQPSEKPTLISELGSGSLEISMLREGEVAFSGTFPLGTIRLRNAIRPAHRSLAESYELMRTLVASPLDMIEHTCSLGDVHNFVIVGGDARFAADRITRKIVDGEQVKVVGRRDFLQFTNRMFRKRPEEIAQQYSLPFQDCETLAPALLVYSELLKRTSSRGVMIPFVSMRDGMLLDYVAEQTGQGLDELERQIIASTESIGRKFQYDESHAHHVVDLACRLYDQLQDEHRLGRRERRLLRVAGLLHDVGMFISNQSHHKHSEYIIRNSEIFGLRPEERNLVATVARYHRRALPKPTHPSYTALSRKDRAIVSKVAAILRVADALDRSHSRKFHDLKVKFGTDEVVLHLTPRDDLTLERLAMRTKGDLFEEVFGRKITLQC